MTTRFRDIYLNTHGHISRISTLSNIAMRQLGNGNYGIIDFSVSFIDIAMRQLGSDDSDIIIEVGE